MVRHAIHAEKSMTGAHIAGGILPRSFYQRDAVTVARELLGKILVNGDTAGIIVETEAYPGGDDLASHSAAGITDRTRVIFGPPGHAYVYLSYGIHTCMNIVAEAEGTAGCVLIRALEPVAGVEAMRGRRQGARRSPTQPRDLASGPGKLTQALGITLGHYGADLTRGEFVVKEPAGEKRFHIDVTPRIGITKCADRPLRFVIRTERS
jgi:DNA-3-methyladenine glycosylase